MKKNRPIDLSLQQVIAINAKSPIAIGSILHRVSGIVLFLLVPFLLYALQMSLATPEGFNVLHHNVLLRALVGLFAAAMAYHFVMGIKHLIADMGVGEDFKTASSASTAAIVIGVVGAIAAFFWVML